MLSIVLSFIVLPSMSAQAAPITGCSITSSLQVMAPMQGATPEDVTTISVTPSALGGQDYYLVFAGPDDFVRDGLILITGPQAINFSWQQLLSQVLETYGVIYTPVLARVLASASTTIDGAECEVSVVLLPNGQPQAPSGVVGTAGDGSATVSWTPWSGGEFQSFTATASPGGATCSATYPEVSCVVDGLANGTPYTFTVVTTTTGGESEPSTPSEPVTPSGSDPGPGPGPGPDPDPSPDNGGGGEGGGGGTVVPVTPRYTG